MESTHGKDPINVTIIIKCITVYMPAYKNQKGVWTNVELRLTGEAEPCMNLLFDFKSTNSVD